MKSIYVENVTKNYGNKRGVDGITLHAEKGETVGFIGPNGAGKSTTIHLILNLIFPDSGKITINGIDAISKGSLVRKIIGYAPSEVNYYGSMKVSELLDYSLKFYDKKKLVPGRGKILRYCGALDLDCSRRIGDLSLGNKKKLALVQSLAHDPEILILDEPTNGLDPLVKKTLFELLHEESERGKTIFFSSHSMVDVQELCERVVFIKEGKIIDEGARSFALRKKMKNVTVKLSREMGDFFEENKHVSNLKKNGHGKVYEYVFLYTGEIGELVRSMDFNYLEDINIEEASLEEIFMHHYK